MSIQSEINRIESNILMAYGELARMGAEIPSEKNSQNLMRTVRSMYGEIGTNKLGYMRLGEGG